MKRAFIALLFCLLHTHVSAQSATPGPDRVRAALDVVEKEYLRAIERERLEADALRSFLSDLDPYSTYMDADEWALYESSFAGSFGGIGVTLQIDRETGLPQVGYLMHGSAAQPAGIRRGDQIVTIDGASLEGLPLEDVITRLRGAPGTTVAIIVRRPSAPDLGPLKLERRVVDQPSVRGVRRDASGSPDFMLDAARGIGYIRILGFGDDTVAMVEKALAALETRKMKGLVLDLRGCSGGKMAAATTIADLFLDSGRIVSVASRNETEVIDAQPGVKTPVPMVMLIDAETASSAEILAGALADNKRATAVGQRTFGKGRIQRKIALPEGLGGVVLTTGTFQRPSGATFDRHDSEDAARAGIAPAAGMDVPLTKDEFEAWRAEMDRLDGPFVLTLEEQKPAAADRVLARGVEVVEAHLRELEIR